MAVRHSRASPPCPVMSAFYRLRVPPLIRASTLQHNPWGFENNLQVNPERPFSDIVQVKPNHFVEALPAPSFHLPKPGNPRLCRRKSPAVPEVIDFALVGEGGPRPHQRHLASQDVNKLGDFVQTGLPQNISQGCNSSVVGQFVDHRFLRFDSDGVSSLPPGN